MAKKPKINGRGRNENGRFAKFNYATLCSPAWRALSPTAQRIYPYILLTYRGEGAWIRNGEIALPCRVLADAVGSTPSTVARALQDLQAKGFLVLTKHGRIGVSGYGKASLYEITEISLPGTTQGAGRHLFREWRRGRDFEIARCPVQNGSGANGRKNLEPRHRDATNRAHQDDEILDLT